MQTAIASIFVFGLLILVHELGHYFAARLTGVKVIELAIGFGPKLVGWEKNDIAYSLRAVPLGGFCRMLGESPEEADEVGSFPSKPAGTRALVLVSGAAMNLLLALLVFFLVFFFFVGVPDMDSAEIGYLVEGAPAGEAGLQPGDRIISIDGLPVQSWQEVLNLISVRPQQEISLAIEREGEELSFAIVSEAENETGRGIIGIGPQVRTLQFWPALQVSLDRYAMILTSIYQVFSGQAPMDVAGPVGIVYVIGEVAQTGLVNLLMLTGLISISLGIMNLLPIPALDGGRLFFLLVEKIRGRRIDPEKEGLIHFIGFALLITLILFVTYQDILRWVMPNSN